MDGWRGSQRLNLTVSSLIAGSWATEQLFIALTWLPEDARDLCRVTRGAVGAPGEAKETVPGDLDPAGASAPAH